MQSNEPAMPSEMQAWCARRYGGPDVLVLKTVPVPRMRAHDVLIAVEATTVSSADHRIRALDLPEGMRLAGRLMLGLTAPRQPVLGTELTGRIVRIGERVRNFSVGDAVIAFPGARMGAHAQFCRMDERGPVVARPAEMPITTAAALAFGGTTARHFLRRADLAAGERVLVIGAAGTVGSALVQLARLAGAEVAAVTSTANIETVRALGAGRIIDYARQDYEHDGQRYDIVADAVGALNYARAIKLLEPGGRYLAIAGGLADLLARPKGGTRPIAGPAAERREDVAELVELARTGRFRPLVDSVFPFSEMPAAHARVDTGRKCGSVVVMADR